MDLDHDRNGYKERDYESTATRYKDKGNTKDRDFIGSEGGLNTSLPHLVGNPKLSSPVGYKGDKKGKGKEKSPGIVDRLNYLKSKGHQHRAPLLDKRK